MPTKLYSGMVSFGAVVWRCAVWGDVIHGIPEVVIRFPEVPFPRFRKIVVDG